MSGKLIGLEQAAAGDSPRRTKAFYLCSAAMVGSLGMLDVIMICATLAVWRDLGGLSGAVSDGLILRLGVLVAALMAMLYIWRRIKRSVAALDAVRD